MPLTTGQIVENRYRIVRLLGQGDSGAVYRAWDLKTRRPCTLKENRVADYKTHLEFIRYARQLFKLRHHNLARLTDYFVIPGKGQYMVMEYIDGEDLEGMLARTSGPLPDAQAVSWFEQISLALDYLHTQTPPVVHRGVNPADILIMTQQGEQAVLVDYGPPSIIAPLSAQNAQEAKAAYLPPERGSGAMGVRGDIYALGATAYHMLTGQRPPDCTQRKAGTKLPKPRSLNPGIPARVEQAIVRAMELAPEKRFSSVAEFAETVLGRPLRSALAQAPVAAPPAAQPPSRRATRQAAPAPKAAGSGRKLIRWLALGMLLCVLAVAAGLYVYTYLLAETFEAQITAGQVTYQPGGPDSAELRVAGDVIPFDSGSIVVVEQGVTAFSLPGNFRLWMSAEPNGLASRVEFYQSGQPGEESHTILRLVDGSLVVCNDGNADPVITFSVETLSGKTILVSGLMGVRYNGPGSKVMEVDCFDGRCTVEAGATKTDIQANQRVIVDPINGILMPTAAAWHFYTSYPLQECLPAGVAPPVLAPTLTFTESLLPSPAPSSTFTNTPQMVPSATATAAPSNTPAGLPSLTLTWTPISPRALVAATSTPSTTSQSYQAPPTNQPTTAATEAIISIATKVNSIPTNAVATWESGVATFSPKKTRPFAATEESGPNPDLFEGDDVGSAGNVSKLNGVRLVVIFLGGLGMLILITLILIGISRFRHARR